MYLLKSVLTAQVLNLLMSDDLEQWRIKKSDNLAALVQSDFRRLQNNLSCTSDAKVYCHINKPFPCGFGCQIHDMAGCFSAALYLNRTMILYSDNWDYRAKNYEEFFKPLSDTCVLQWDEPIPVGLNWTGR